MAVARYLDNWDYVTIVTLILISSIFGFYHIVTAKRIKNPKNFVLSGEGIGLLPLVLSITATSSSAVQMLAFPVEAYFNDISFLSFGLNAITVVMICTHLYLPVFFQSNISTVFEYLELRFNKFVRILASIAITVQIVIIVCRTINIYAPAEIVHQVTGLHPWASITIIGIICLLYTSLGGFTAVIWADVVQCIVALGVLILLIIKGTVDTGGPGTVWENLKEGNRTNIFASSTDVGYSPWTLFIGGTFFFGSYYASHQLNMQRYLSNKTLPQARRSVYGGAVGIFVCHVLYATVGFVMYAYYHKCDPILEGRIKFRDQSVALFAVDILSDYKGLNGVFIGGLMCATISSLSSFLNTLAAVTVSDYVPLIKPNLSDRALKNISKISVLAYGVVCVVLVILIENIGSLENMAKIVFGVYGVTVGAVFTAFTIGMLLPWVNSKGAICGFIGSMVIPLWSFIGSCVSPQFLYDASLSVEGCSNFSSGFNFTENIATEKTLLDEFYSIAVYWYPLMCLTSGLIISLIANYALGKGLIPGVREVTLEDDVIRPAEIPLLDVTNQTNKIVC